MKEWLARTALVEANRIAITTSGNSSVPETKIDYCL